MTRPKFLHTYLGDRFGRLTVLAPVPRKDPKRVRWFCYCDCGNFATVEQSQLHNGKTRSCRCLRNEKSANRWITHQQRDTPAYGVWATMKQRTTNPASPDWRYYGGRGIKLCDRWHNFDNFLEDMGQPLPGLTIDRINVDGNYEPSNCRWATRKEQRANQRPREVGKTLSLQP